MKHWGIAAGWLVLWVTLLGVPATFAQTPGQTTQQTPNPWVELLKNPNPKARAKAAREMGKSGDTTTVPALTAALTDANPQVRREVVMALSQFHDSASLDAVISATRDPEPSVRVLAVKGLVGYYTGESPSAGFSPFFRRQYRRVKGHFVHESTRIDPGVKVNPTVTTALVETMKDERAIEPAREAAKGLGILLAQPAVPDLVKAAHSTDEDLAREALEALSKIKDTSAGPRLVDLLDSTMPDVKRDAAVTLGILRTHEALAKLQWVYENDPEQKNKEKAIEGLAFVGDPASIPVFKKALSSNAKPVRTSAAEGLARVKDPNTLPDLEKAMGEERDAGVKLALEYAITAVGKEDYLAGLVHELTSILRSDVAQAYLIELARDPKFLPKLYTFLSEDDATVRKKLCRVLMFAGDQSSLNHLDRLTHDKDTEVASEAIRASRAIRARVALPAPAPAPTPATAQKP